MVTGSSLLVQIQIAFIGIVVVLGTFYIWRMISRLEERVEKLALNCSCGPKSQQNQSCASRMTSSYPEEDEYADEMMRVYGNIQDRGLQHQFIIPDMGLDDKFETMTNGVVISQYNNNDDDDEQFEEYFAQSRQQRKEPLTNDTEAETEADTEAETEAYTEADTTLEVSPVIESYDVDNFSEAETETENPLSKSKLKRMSADKLKELCKDRSLPIDGSKALLIDRILGITRN